MDETESNVIATDLEWIDYTERQVMRWINGEIEHAECAKLICRYKFPDHNFAVKATRDAWMSIATKLRKRIEKP